MSGWPLLSIITFLPLLGAALIVLLAREDEATKHRDIRMIALLVTVVNFLLSLLILAQFDPSDPGFQLVERADWLSGSITYQMGVDGISVLFVILTTVLMPFCILASWESVQTRVKEYMVAFLLL
ncbi:MAG: NADH-quinone oxidoreductase subunit M, partial [Pseudomonadota bacterium]